jgi:hypothetical protein
MPPNYSSEMRGRPSRYQLDVRDLQPGSTPDEEETRRRLIRETVDLIVDDAILSQAEGGDIPEFSHDFWVNNMILANP